MIALSVEGWSFFNDLNDIFAKKAIFWKENRTTNEIAKFNNDLTTEDDDPRIAGIKKAERRAIRSISRCRLFKNEQPVNPSICLARKRCEKQRLSNYLVARIVKPTKIVVRTVSIFTGAKDFKNTSEL